MCYQITEEEKFEMFMSKSGKKGVFDALPLKATDIVQFDIWEQAVCAQADACGLLSVLEGRDSGPLCDDESEKGKELRKLFLTKNMKLLYFLRGSITERHVLARVSESVMREQSAHRLWMALHESFVGDSQNTLQVMHDKWSNLR